MVRRLKLTLEYTVIELYTYTYIRTAWIAEKGIPNYDMFEKGVFFL